ncbi:MAG: YxlC family protein [Bacillota bacterium]
MSSHDDQTGQPGWERLLKQGLDRVGDLGDEQPPNLGALQMLVAATQAEQRRQLQADLLKFWAVAAMLLAVLAFAYLEEPVYFIAFQGAVTLLSLVGAVLWYAGARRVTE